MCVCLSQRQTLIMLLRSCPNLSERENNPAINERLCGSDGDAMRDEFNSIAPSSLSTRRRSTAEAIAAISNTEQVEGEEDSATAMRRWRLTDHFNPSTTTHLVTCREASPNSSQCPCPRTANLFKALMASTPVVDEAWIKESTKVSKWLPHHRFLVCFYSFYLCSESVVLF